MTANGRAIDEIARMLDVSPSTVKRDLSMSMCALGVRTRPALTAHAVALGLVQVSRGGGDSGPPPA